MGFTSPVWRRIFSSSHRRQEQTPVEDHPRPRLQRKQGFIRTNSDLEEFAIETPRMSTEFFPSTVPTSRPSTACPLVPQTRAESISSIPSSPTQSLASSKASPSPPISFFNTATTRRTRSFRTSTNRNSRATSTSSFADPDPDCPLVLTLTSKYPTGMAADLYVPVDLTVPRQSGLIRTLSNRARPASGILNANLNVSLPTLHLDFDRPRPPAVLHRRMSKARRQSLSEANRFYY